MAYEEDEFPIGTDFAAMLPARKDKGDRTMPNKTPTEKPTGHQAHKSTPDPQTRTAIHLQGLESRMHGVEIEFANLRKATLAAAERFPDLIRNVVRESLTPLATKLTELSDSQQELAQAILAFLHAEQLQTIPTIHAEQLTPKRATTVSQSCARMDHQNCPCTQTDCACHCHQ